MSRTYLTKEFQRRVISWFHQKGRVFYWRKNVLNPWQWLVLELLLKKTRAETVEKVFPKFIAKYSEQIEAVEQFLAGSGYSSRAQLTLID